MIYVSEEQLHLLHKREVTRMIMIHIAMHIREDPRSKSNDSLAEMQVRSLHLFDSER